MMSTVTSIPLNSLSTKATTTIQTESKEKSVAKESTNSYSNSKTMGDIPKASDVEHVHNSTGWKCFFECKETEHTHTIDECYTKGDTLVCDYHEHVDACYDENGELICGKKALKKHFHTQEDCYEFICENVEEEHEHTLQECYKLICNQQESEGHEHSDICYCILTCDKPEHTHDETCEREWTCETDYVLLSVEYYISVNGQMVRAASTYQALLMNADEYKVSIEDLRKDGYKIGTVNRYTAGQEDVAEKIDVIKENGKFYVSGTIEKDTKIIVNYVYQEEYAPYRIEYWGYNMAGKDQVLLYSYTGQGKKDSQISVSQDEINVETISISVNDLMKNLYDILGNQRELGNSGEEFIKNLTYAVNEKYLTGSEENNIIYHDITPFLEHIAGISESDDAKIKKDKLNRLTRLQIKNYIAEKLVKVYGFDQNSQQVWDAKLTVTADKMAVRNLYYVPKKPQTVLFTTGISKAEVIGIPDKPFAAEPDADNITLNYDIKLSKNYITSLPTVDIHKYTKNIYAKHQSYIFVGWVSGEDAQVITDYTPLNASGKYKDLTIYTADGDPKDAGTPSPIPPGVKTVPLAEVLTKMPDAGATYYAVWQPYGAAYTVQLWFESEKGDNTYIESHSHDIQRYDAIGMPITFNDFDVNRANEDPINKAANQSTNAIFDTSVTFSDSASNTSDIYHSYADYKNSAFYGFDFLECDVCKNDSSKCGTSGCTCGYQRLTNGDGSEGTATTIKACNYQKVSIKEDGTTVLNLYYTREMWEIALTPSVQLWTVQALQRPTEFNIYTYWTGGKEQKDIIDALNADKLACEKDPSLMESRIIRGKYGTKVEDAYKNGIGWDNIGSGWQNLITDSNKTQTIPAGTDVLLANGSEAFQPRGAYVYPQDTINYINSAAGTIPAPADWELPFNCLSTIEPEMFTSRTAKHQDDDPSKDYVTIQNKVSMWEGQRFGEESSYDLSTNTYTYGTHRLNVYPYYHALSDKEDMSVHTFNINYYMQALPHEAVDTPYVYTTKNNDEIKFVKDVKEGEDYTVTLNTPAEKLAYGADTPEGFIPLMWRTSPLGFYGLNAWNRGDFQGQGVIDAAQRYTYPQVTSTGLPNQMTLATLKINATFPSGIYKGRYHNASFNKDNLQTLNGNSVYRSDWRQWYALNRPTQEAASVGSMDPGGYWVVDWIRAGDPGKSNVQLNGSLTGKNGLYDLFQQANQGNKDAQTLLDQLESSFSVGMLFPTGNSEILYYLSNNANAFRYSNAGTARLEKELVDTENAIAFARNQYSITYNTCFLNEDGEVLRDEDGIVMVKLYTTSYETGDSGDISGIGDMVYYDQPLGYDPDKGGTHISFDKYYNNYYDAYFTLDKTKNPTDDDAFIFKGYGNASKAVATYKDGDRVTDNETALGGYGRWYLDPDGTIPFNEENLQKMPAGNVDVYYRYNDFRYNVYFVDEVTGKDEEPIDVVVNGENRTLNSVINKQTVMPSTTAESFPNPDDANLYFAGWFYDEEGTNPYDFNMEINEDTVVYAVWKPKVPTEYKIRHILVDIHGSEIREVIDSKWQKSYVGNTIDANALDSEYYVDGMYFKVDDYSQSMVLEAQNKDKTKNILTFYYTYAGLRYTIKYKDINSGVEILPSVTHPTKLSTVTVGMTEIPGWEYQGYSINDDKLASMKRHATVNVTTDGVVVTFWYERIPADDEIMALKLVDGVLSKGTWFHFELIDENGKVVRTAQSIDGIIQFDSLGLDKVGTYRYILREVNEDNEYRIDYDDTEYEVVIEVTQPDITKPLICNITYYKDGKLYEGNSPNINGNDDKKIVPIFENHRLSANVQLEAKKYLDNELMNGTGFAFLLQGGKGLLDCGYHIHDDSCYELQLICGLEEDENNEEGFTHEHFDICYEKVLICHEEESIKHKKHIQSCYSAPTTLIEESIALNGKIEFKPLWFDEIGTYVYNIHERNDANTSYTYDDTLYRVAIEVFINNRNELDTKVTITRDGEQVENIRFDNYTVITPSDPTKPNEKPNNNKNPNKPIIIEENIDNKNNANNVNTINTGDSSDLYMYITLLWITGISLVYILIHKRKLQ